MRAYNCKNIHSIKVKPYISLLQMLLYKKSADSNRVRWEALTDFYWNDPNATKSLLAKTLTKRRKAEMRTFGKIVQ